MYSTLEEIEARKAQLKKDLDMKQTEISERWNELFHPADQSRLTLSPTQRFLSYAQKSAGLIDGAILGWKLYHRFFGSRRRR